MIRGAFKLTLFLWTSLRAFADFLLHVRGKNLRARAEWSQRWAQTYLQVLDIQVTCHGVPPHEGLLACNHLSYLDIVVLSAVQPQIFLSKREVKHWPLIGALAQCAGTLFINRQRRADVAELQTAFQTVITQNLPLTLFPEGTSSNGSTVLPFYSSLLEPAVQQNWPVTPAHISYSLDDGNPAEDICYWKDMTFLPHFLKLLTKKKIQATITLGEPLTNHTDRKQLAITLRHKVLALAHHSPLIPVEA